MTKEDADLVTATLRDKLETSPDEVKTAVTDFVRCVRQEALYAAAPPPEPPLYFVDDVPVFRSDFDGDLRDKLRDRIKVADVLR